MKMDFYISYTSADYPEGTVHMHMQISNRTESCLSEKHNLELEGDQES